jgi:microcystin degradation protein MlrC
MRIAVGGFQHETNTFSEHLATLAHFEAPDAWPGLTRGPALFEAVAGINLPAAGFVAEARGLRHDLVALTWCSAQPSGRVTRQAFEHVTELLLEDLRAAGGVDAVYLDLHGAMVAEHVDDADGEVLRRVRELVGPDVPVVSSLDYHANVSRQMVEAASALVAYKTYPHVDMAECGARAARCLHDLLGKPRPACRVADARTGDDGRRSRAFPDAGGQRRARISGRGRGRLRTERVRVWLGRGARAGGRRTAGRGLSRA